MPWKAGRELATWLIDQLEGTSCIDACGKGVIVREDGEFEHGAIWHDAGG